MLGTCRKARDDDPQNAWEDLHTRDTWFMDSSATRCGLTMSSTINMGEIMSTTGRLAMLVGVLTMGIGCATTKDAARTTAGGTAAGTVVATNSSKCDYTYTTTNYATVAETDFVGECLAPRGDPTDVVRIPKEAAEFANKCAIKLDIVTPAAPGSECDSARAPLQRNDRMLVTDWGDDTYTLTHRQGTNRFLIPLTKGVPPTGTGVPYLHGDRDGVAYFVYIEYARATGGRFKKFYRFEVFDTQSDDWGTCQTHQPTQSATLDTCRERTSSGPSQTGTSTGGEPPPR